MPRSLVRTLAAVWSFVFAAALAQEQPDQIREGTQTAHLATAPDSYPYLLFVPRGYAAMPSQQWPLVIYLHSAGSLGDDLDLVRQWGLPKAIASHPGAPFFLLSPQAEGSLQTGGQWDTERLERLLANLRGAYRIDADRIYLTGWSIGGNETWRWAIRRPDLFAAAVPIGGHGNFKRDDDLQKVCELKDMPVWAFNGDRDAITPPGMATRVVAALQRCPDGTQQPRLTILPATGHNAADPAYADPALWLWLLEQRRPAAALPGAR